MKIVFKNGFEIKQSELSNKSLEELYDLHQDLVMSYSHHDDKGVIGQLETYIDLKVQEEQELTA